MPTPGKQWRHVIISTLGAWLPGDPRGWRARHHKRHSSGDYRNLPPAGEHHRLYQYSLALCPTAVTIPKTLRLTLGVALRDYLSDLEHTVLVLSVGGQHAHLLVELPANMPTVKTVIGEAKQTASRTVRKQLPGRVWAGSGKFLPVRDEAHHRQVFAYIRDHIHEGAWVWSFNEGEVDRPGGA